MSDENPESRNDPDADLVRALQESPHADLRAFQELVSRHQGRILANCRHISGSPADSEDLAQEVFVKAYFNIKRFEGRSKFKTWLQRIKINHCLSHREKSKRRTFVDVDDPSVTEDLAVPAEGESKLEQQDSREQIRHTLEQLPETLRVPLVLREVDGLSYQEIADGLGIGLSAVKMRIKRGRTEFRKLYGDRE